MGRVPRSCIPGWPRLYRTLRSIRLKEVPLTEPRAPHPERSRGYAPFAVSEEQDEALAAIRAAAGRPGAVGIFDLDGCLLTPAPEFFICFVNWRVNGDCPISIVFVQSTFSIGTWDEPCDWRDCQKPG